MIAVPRSRLVLLCFSAIAPVAVAMSCATPVEDDGCGNTQTDVFNCGACGRPCAKGQFCRAGQCACDAPYEACGLSCLNLEGDPNNCGSCGNVCPPTAGFCSNRVCSATCAQTTCGNLCVNTSNDIFNCGACGTLCPAGASCSNGSCSCPVGTMLCGNACMVSCGAGGSGATGTGGTTSSGGAGGQAPTGGAAGSGMAGSGGMEPVMKLCAKKVALTAPTITDFESYDGTKPAYGTDSWTFTMGPTTAPAYAGLYALSERTVGETPPMDYLLTLSAGANASMWAARAENMTTTDWGGGIGMWMGCIDATAYTGISFMVRGSGPAGMANVSIAMEDATAPTADPAGGGTCEPAPTEGCAGPSYEFPITIDWTEITVPWAMFAAGRGAAGAAVAATGDEITGISFGVKINYVPNPVDGGMPAYVPEPGSFEIAVDNLTFTQ